MQKPYVYIYTYTIIYVYVYTFQNQGLQEYPQGSPMHINIYVYKNNDTEIFACNMYN
jgi:hypothetical protein